VAERVVLAVDVGGSHVKVLASDQQDRRRVPSGPTMTAAEMVALALGAAEGWNFDVVSVGIPAPVHGGRVVLEPVNLGKGWVGYDFEQAFGKPTKVLNDAAMQAVGSYDGGKMLFLGLGTGLGTALIDNDELEPMELGHLSFRKKTFEEYVGERARKRLGDRRWSKVVLEVIETLRSALEPDYVVLGGGNAARLATLPDNTRLGNNRDAFTGGFRLWSAPAGALEPAGGSSEPSDAR
jgi:polyphosphate glucokinase